MNTNEGRGALLIRSGRLLLATRRRGFGRSLTFARRFVLVEVKAEVLKDGKVHPPSALAKRSPLAARFHTALAHDVTLLELLALSRRRDVKVRVRGELFGRIGRRLSHLSQRFTRTRSYFCGVCSPFQRMLCNQVIIKRTMKLIEGC